MKYIIRPIQYSDNLQVARIIRTVMPEFGADGPGFAIHDLEVDDMFTAYSQARSFYFVVTHERQILGGGGIAPLEGAETSYCELRKMYFLNELRGNGFGQEILNLCLQKAKDFAFKYCYLETLITMTQARQLYLKNNFRRLDKPLGTTGHYSCDYWFLKELAP